MSEAQDIIDRYNFALHAYKLACATFTKIRNKIPALSRTEAEDYALFKAKREFSAACKIYAHERNVFLAATRRVTNLPVGEVEQAQEIINQNIVSEFADTDWYKTIAKAAKERKGTIQASNDSNTPIEEKVFETTDEPDVFKDLP